MIFLFINEYDASKYCSDLKVSNIKNYTTQTNAAGNTVVDYINTKHALELGFIALDDSQEFRNLIGWLSSPVCSVSYRNPITGEPTASVDYLVDNNSIEYYTIQANKVMYKAFKVKLTEL